MRSAPESGRTPTSTSAADDRPLATITTRSTVRPGVCDRTDINARGKTTRATPTYPMPDRPARVSTNDRTVGAHDEAHIVLVHGAFAEPGSCVGGRGSDHTTSCDPPDGFCARSRSSGRAAHRTLSSRGGTTHLEIVRMGRGGRNHRGRAGRSGVATGRSVQRLSMAEVFVLRDGLICQRLSGFPASPGPSMATSRRLALWRKEPKTQPGTAPIGNLESRRPTEQLCGHGDRSVESSRRLLTPERLSESCGASHTGA